MKKLSYDTVKPQYYYKYLNNTQAIGSQFAFHRPKLKLIHTN